MNYKFPHPTSTQPTSAKVTAHWTSTCFYLLVTLLPLTASGAALTTATNRCQPPSPECVDSSKPAPEITQINIRVHPIFDEAKPAENNALFRLVNRLHIETHPGVIKHDLLFKQGDRLDPEKLAESERVLRTRRYLNKASVSAEPAANGQTEVNVDAYQVWTLVPAISYSHAGGNTNINFGLHDSNFLGYGKIVNIFHTSSAERSGELYEYRDPNTGWHQTSLAMLYENNNDGTHHYFSFERPYFSLSTPNAGGISDEQYDQEDKLYNEGKEVGKFAHSAKDQEVFYGSKISALSQGQNIHRWNLGYSQQEDSFTRIDTNNYQLPQNRSFDTTWIEYQFIRDGYIEANNIQQINRVEDINLGLQARMRIGYARSSSSAYNDSYQFSGDLTQGFAFNATNLLLASVNFSGLYDNNIYNGLTNAQVDYHWQNFSRGQFYIGLQASRGLRLFGDQPLVLGGDTGLRGYPANYEMGDKRYLMNIEQRFYGTKEWFSLFYLGMAVFYDQGRAWGESLIPQTQQGQLRDLGIGLRISGTRTGNREEGAHNILHLDLATPLDGSSDISHLQWLVKVRQTF